ncbi:hypothetical protein RHIZ404_200113 [Rhizobium sp. EC-SD404]|nr:hypothetical protein RHIZ404_200113 [Rhizobium sp. EC-SD404]
MAADRRRPVFGRQRDVEAIGILHAVRPVQRPMQHVAGLEVVDAGMRIEPGLVGHLFLGAAADDVFEILRLQEGLAVRVDVDPLFPANLPERLAGNIGVVEDLGVGRGDQEAHRLADDLHFGNLRADFGEHLVQQCAEFRDHVVHRGDVDPDATLAHRIDELLAAQIAALAVRPCPRIVTAAPHRVDRHLVGFDRVENASKLLVTKEGSFMQPVPQLHVVMSPKRTRLRSEIREKICHLSSPQHVTSIGPTHGIASMSVTNAVNHAGRYRSAITRH